MIVDFLTVPTPKSFRQLQIEDILVQTYTNLVNDTLFGLIDSVLEHKYLAQFEILKTKYADSFTIQTIETKQRQFDILVIITYFIDIDTKGDVHETLMALV